ncbi:hypothetical protein [Longimicrobium terrae]|uniref:DUF2993 domain-containing protein n=1 Tax=Longimicrobium terrae TaxID=1639882 RepID=A0A841GN37_9BACT|nr:hypothetical protein [Longimicrobium terrae]MBB4634388.1 hypothetical protein [Longimicrobium terrae]MBB6068722.1 hypothetical protein [Longimicrobium terrae]NNC27908.1 hypothetical protein [Longimicrobium terrae]
MARGAGGKVLLLVLLALVAAGLWTFRGLIPGPWQRSRVVTEVSEAGAVSADEKLKRLREDGDTVRLSGIEFTSYVRYRMAQRFAQDLETPIISFEGEKIRVDGRVPKDKLPLEKFGAAAQFVPDTADVMVDGTMRMVAEGRAALRVQDARFAKVAVPRDRYLPLLKNLRLPTDTQLAEDEVGVQLPPGVGSARVENGELVLAK